MKGYSTKEVSDLLELEAPTIREFARAGVLDPARADGNQYRFAFQDIVVLRTAKDLMDAGIPRTRINKALYKLKSELPSNRSLTSLRIECDSGSVVIKDEDQLYDPDTGQMHINFSVAELAGSVAPLAKKAAENASKNDNMSSDDWFDLGVDLEAVSPQDAPAAYFKALELDPLHSDAHVNLGRLLQEDGKLEDAEKHYLKALSADEDNMLAAFNLGTLYEDLGKIQEAIDTYKKAGNLADAHYNLSRLYELVGEHGAALEHLKAYRQLVDPVQP